MVDTTTLPGSARVGSDSISGISPRMAMRCFLTGCRPTRMKSDSLNFSTGLAAEVAA
jgi:hypothetical protein